MMAVPRLSELEGMKLWFEACYNLSKKNVRDSDVFQKTLMDPLVQPKPIITYEPYLIYQRYADKKNVFVSLLPVTYDKEIKRTLTMQTRMFKTFQSLTDYLDDTVKKNSRVYLYTLEAQQNFDENRDPFLLYFLRSACTRSIEVDSVKGKFQTLKSRIMELNGHSIIIDKVGTPIYPCEIEKELSELEAEIEKLYQ